MNQTNSLSDALSKSSSLLSGLLSQISGAYGSALSQNSLFSSLVSSNDAMQAATASQNQNASGTASSASSSLTPSSSSSDALSPTDPLTSASKLTQSTNDLAYILRKALALLRSKSHSAASASSDAAGTTTVSTQQTTDSSATQSSSSSDTATSVAATPSTDTASSVSDTARTLSDLIAELLMLAQMIVQQLQQAQLASGANATAGATQITDTLTAQTTNGLTAGVLDQASGSVADSSASLTDPLLQLLKKMGEDAQKLFSSGASSVDCAATAAALVASELAAKLAQLNAEIKNTLAALQQPSSAALVSQAATLATQADLTTPLVTTTKTAATADTASKRPSAETTTPQFFAAPAAQESIPTPTLGVAALSSSVAGDTSGNASANSDFLSGGGQSSSFAATTSPLGSGLTAEGAQASGTYSFASTLSAFRAANGGATGLPSVVDQVILQMNRSVKTGNNQMSLQLQPGDLGKITIKLDFSAEGKVQGTVTADNPQTLDMLQKDSRSLERALQDAGLRADPGSLRFDLSGQGSQNNAGQTANGNGNVSGNGTVSASEGTETELVDLGTLSDSYYLTPSGVNIRV